MNLEELRREFGEILVTNYDFGHHGADLRQFIYMCFKKIIPIEMKPFQRMCFQVCGISDSNFEETF